jgi:conjugative transfer signal peptidase TraF
VSRPRIHTYAPFYVLAGAALGISLIVATWPHWGPSLLINATRSEPTGFYRLVSHEPQEYRRGMSVVFAVPDTYRELVYARGWLPDGVPLLKTIVALAGDRVCVYEERFEVNGRTLGPVYVLDSSGAAMPRIRGCFEIKQGYFFPASTYNPRSFDGRYIGAQPLSVLRGEARPLWTF